MSYAKNTSHEISYEESRYSHKVYLICAFIVCIALPLFIGTFASVITMDNMSVFTTIQKPPFTPPAIIFPFAWTILYTLMGLASYLALVEARDLRSHISYFVPYMIQLGLNFLWSIIFFNGQLYVLALICLILLWVSVLWNMISFSSIKPSAGYLLIPYLVWLTFAFYLNLMICLLN